MDLLLLFAASLLAATIVPAQSEVVLAGLALAGNHSLVVLVAVATFGNVLGACINWLLGRTLEHFKNKRWFTEGDEAVIHVTNKLDEPTSIHWHGLLIDGAMDGVTGFNGYEAIKPNTTFTYRFPPTCRYGRGRHDSCWGYDYLP